MERYVGFQKAFRLSLVEKNKNNDFKSLIGKN